MNIKMKFYKKFKMNLNFNTHSQAEAWKHRLCPLGGDCYHTNIWHKKEPRFYFEYIIYNGAIAIAPYRYLFYANFIKWCVGKRTQRVSK